MKSHVSDPNAITALLAVDLPGTVHAADLPDEIQWMPPGEHEINASRGDQPVKLNVKVDAATAQRIAASHRQHMSAVSQGAEDLPYFDFNHEDREASGHPTEFYWGGDDPQQGGVRAKLNWTGAGRQAIVGRNFRRFSPSFYANEKGDITAAPVNMGGLVNRAAFKRIAPILSKAVEVAIVNSRDTSFVEKVTTLAKARNLTEPGAMEVLARERLDLYLEYRIGLGLGDRRHNQRELTQAREDVRQRANYEADEFFIEARALSEALDVDLVKVATQLCGSRPALYERYRARLMGIELDSARISAVQARAEESAFMARSRQVAAERGIDITAAFMIVAHETPELVEAYREAL